MLSKPLALILQLAALVLIVSGAASEPLDGKMIAIGIVILLVSGWSIRKRINKGS